MLDEADKVLACGYCRTRLYISAHGCLRYGLTPPDMHEQELLFAPFWRFRGMEFTCRGTEIKKRVLDTTLSATNYTFFPSSLGLRPQAMRLRFVSPSSPARYLEPQRAFKDAFLQRNANTALPGTDRRTAPFFQEFIGETVSLIYAPYYIKDGALYDAVCNSRAGALDPGGGEELLSGAQQSRWRVSFVPTLCPHCGWQLSGESQSCILLCANCDRVWKVSGEDFEPVACRIVPCSDPDAVYIPFWKMSAAVEGPALTSYADLIRFVNLPRAIKPEWERRQLYFWSPAFKIQPNLFMRIARLMTILQPEQKVEEALGGLPCYPVTLPAGEEAESIKITMGIVGRDKKRVLPALPDIRVSLQSCQLMFFPFSVKTNELVACGLDLGIDRAALSFGKKI